MQNSKLTNPQKNGVNLKPLIQANIKPLPINLELEKP